MVKSLSQWFKRSCVSPPGHRRAFLLPDRSKYVNMEKRFLRSYMDLLVQTCHRRGALATGGMAALLLPQNPLSDSHRRVLAIVTRWGTSLLAHTHWSWGCMLKALQCGKSKFTQILLCILSQSNDPALGHWKQPLQFKQSLWLSRHVARCSLGSGTWQMHYYHH